MVRHPMYTGFIGTALGLTLMHGFGGMIYILLFVLGWLLWRVDREDRWLGIVSMSCPTTSATLTSWALS